MSYIGSISPEQIIIIVVVWVRKALFVRAFLNTTDEASFGVIFKTVYSGLAGLSYYFLQRFMSCVCWEWQSITALKVMLWFICSPILPDGDQNASRQDYQELMICRVIRPQQIMGY